MKARTCRGRVGEVGRGSRTWRGPPGAAWRSGADLTHPALCLPSGPAALLREDPRSGAENRTSEQNTNCPKGLDIKGG